MRLVARFMKPYWALCAVTTVLLLVDVVGALVIPTFAAELLNESATSASFKKMTITAVGMGVAALISGMCAVAGGWCCSQLTSRVGKDMRMALYRKSMDLSIYDFRNFGTASITTRTINDVVNIQMAMTNVLCMLMPVPIIFIIALTLSFRLDVTLSLWLLVAIAFVCVVALFIMRSAAPLFRKLQKLLDRIGAVLLENLTGVRRLRRYVHQGEPAIREPRRPVVLRHERIHRRRVFPRGRTHQRRKLPNRRHHRHRGVCDHGAVLSDDGADGDHHLAEGA